MNVMMNEERYHAVVNMAYLAACAVKDIVPEAERIEEMDLELLYREAERHMMTGITAMALESAGIRDKAFLQAKGKAVRKVAAMDLDRLAVQNMLEKEGIWYMPLKGAVISKFYPRIGMRQMSDNDILFDAERAEDVKAVMEGLGFTTILFGKGSQDVYYKQPVSSFEMHRALFSAKNSKKFTGYYKNIRDRLLKDDGRQFSYYFSNDDYYCYMIAHDYMHYTAGGTGLRSLMDIWVYLDHKGDSLDWDYILTELGKMGIDDYEQKNRRLALHLFRGFELTEEEQRMMAYIANAGSYGTLDQRVQYGLEQYGGSLKGKLRYLWRRVMPSIDYVEEFYPVFYRHRLLLPFFPLYHLKKKWPQRKKAFKKELNLVVRSKKGD